MNRRRVALLALTLLAVALASVAPAAAQRPAPPTFDRAIAAQQFPYGVLLPWPPDLDYQAFLDQANTDLFGQAGAGLTLFEGVTAGQTSYAGTALFQEPSGTVSMQPFTFLLGSIVSVENGTYTDPATGTVVAGQTTWLYGTVFTASGSVDAYMGAVTATHPQAVGHYLYLLEPDTSRSTRDVGEAEPIPSGEEEEDPCDTCINDHNKARNTAVSRHKRCRRKALLWGGGATIIASFGGPWGTAGGLLGTAAAVDACNDTLKDAKEDAIGEYCDCWANSGCDEGNDDYQANCS